MLNHLILIVGLALLASGHAKAAYTAHEQAYEFEFSNNGIEFKIQKSGESRAQAFEFAALECAKKLKALDPMDRIDVCANPVKGF